jgi:hypothetical protein
MELTEKAYSANYILSITKFTIKPLEWILKYEH